MQILKYRKGNRQLNAIKISTCVKSQNTNLTGYQTIYKIPNHTTNQPIAAIVLVQIIAQT